MQAAMHLPIRRRTPAAAVKQQILAFLAEALPKGWLSQPLAENAQGAADILIISPRGRCHFLFVRAPADRWWDGGPHSVPAESFTTEGVHLARKLRAAGHRARAVWSGPDLARALKAWGCPLNRPVRLDPVVAADAVRRRPPRPVLHLAGWGRRADG